MNDVAKPKKKRRQKYFNDHGQEFTEIPQDVKDKFVELVSRVINRGHQQYSPVAIVHVMRWHEHIEKGNREFKICNHWAAPLARWYLKYHPHHEGLFDFKYGTRFVVAEGPLDKPIA